ncbi:uncharacterized protein Z518_08656 [Rhinocladiella mackenziei CBS 650.93]|uniref:Xylanolytic transcriptional activator regulatory domain-containing protein n=1 Tax=Rhinocladiella mackenziei CBS 650.93 TaxID=1442369 RepID=A0A0D2I9Z9_9EURO|nr:uncharacterized protein Z518_08656 [Rhinocladiella mackenziei CBS 650.93]KIX02714.1 hypothetical protein Z518_08656 [Rhinocladiella mackenziei CBS 650.93]
MNRNGRSTGSTGSTIKFKGPTSQAPLSPESCAQYINAYFDEVHPLYPFLDRKEFEEKARQPQLSEFLKLNAPFSALYHSVLALGCQFREEGAFDPGKGKAWTYFQIALGLLPELMIPQETLTGVQSIFATSLSCIQIEEMLISEAARMALALRYNRASPLAGDNPFQGRTFWVIYTVEKMIAFECGRSSVISDYDVGTPIPEAPEAVFDGYDDFLSSARFARLRSQAYEKLFSISATLNSSEQHRIAIASVIDDLERWRMSIPLEFRPGEPFRTQHMSNRCRLTAALRTYFSYYAMLIAVSRLALQVDADAPCAQRQETKNTLMQAARHVIELTRYIDTKAYTQIWILGVMPLSALFILFDLVVHNPTHTETRNNLALLDVAAGHFSRLEYATGGSLPSSQLSEFAYIARQYVREVQTGIRLTSTSTTRDTPTIAPDVPSIPQTSPVDDRMAPAFQVSPAQSYPTRTNSSTITTPNRSDLLHYPNDNFNWIGSPEIPVGFDMRNFFDSLLPSYETMMSEDV